MTSLASRSYLRAPLLGMGMLALFAGLGGGLLRLQWRLPLLGPALVTLHGSLMVSGFLGTLIGLERAVALARPWAYAGPALAGLGAMALIAGFSVEFGALLMSLGSAGLCVAFAHVLRRHRTLPLATMGLGALSWTTGNVLWLLGSGVPDAVPWWIGFLVLTIGRRRGS